MANFFKDRVVEYPGRMKLTPTSADGEYDVTMEEGTVTEEGTPLSAETFNDVIDKYGIWFGRSTTSGSIRTVSCPGFKLVDGSAIAVHFSSNYAGSGYMQINVESTGYKEVRYYGPYNSTVPIYSFDSNTTLLLVYDSNWGFYRSITPMLIASTAINELNVRLNV